MFQAPGPNSRFLCIPSCLLCRKNNKGTPNPANKRDRDKPGNDPRTALHAREAPAVETLKRVIELLHGGTGSFKRSVRVVRPTGVPGTWDGIVHVFDLKDNPQATRAYAWACPISGSDKPRYFALLHNANVRGPGEAVKAAVAAVQKWG